MMERIAQHIHSRRFRDRPDLVAYMICESDVAIGFDPKAVVVAHGDDLGLCRGTSRFDMSGDGDGCRGTKTCTTRHLNEICSAIQRHCVIELAWNATLGAGRTRARSVIAVS